MSENTNVNDDYLNIEEIWDSFIKEEEKKEEDNKDKRISKRRYSEKANAGERVPHVVAEIKDWLKKTSFNDFSKAITSRVKGQEETERILINIYNYLECVSSGKKHNNNMILAAPSGCGKTETYRTIKNYFSDVIPSLVVYQIDMTSITEEGYKGKNTNDIVKLLKETDDGIGLVFMDEFDKKLIPSLSGHGDNVNLAVQNQILTLIEGRIVYRDRDSNSNGKGLNTANTLFIGMGAFNICRENKKNTKRTIGFNDSSFKDVSHYTFINREDMISMGGSYELIGRFSTVINYHELSYDAVDEVIDILSNRVSDNLNIKIVLSDDMRIRLHDNANGRYGCRILESLIRDNAMTGYLDIKKNSWDNEYCTIVINDNKNVYCEYDEERALEDEVPFK